MLLAIFTPRLRVGGFVGKATESEELYQAVVATNKPNRLERAPKKGEGTVLAARALSPTCKMDENW
jgi:hypothetical protein